MAITNTDSRIRMLEGAVGRDFTLGGAINTGDAVYVTSTGTIAVARANAAVTSKAIGVLVALHTGGTAGVSGDRGTVCVFGPVSGYAGIVEGSPVYLDNASDGGLVDAALTGSGKWSRIVGFGEKDGVLFVQPDTALPTSLS